MRGVGDVGVRFSGRWSSMTAGPGSPAAREPSAACADAGYGSAAAAISRARASPST